MTTNTNVGARRDGKLVNLIIMAAGIVQPLTAKNARALGETLICLAGAADAEEQEEHKEAALPMVA